MVNVSGCGSLVHFSQKWYSLCNISVVAFTAVAKQNVMVCGPLVFTWIRFVNHFLHLVKSAVPFYKAVVLATESSQVAGGCKHHSCYHLDTRHLVGISRHFRQVRNFLKAKVKIFINENKNVSQDFRIASLCHC